MLLRILSLSIALALLGAGPPARAQDPEADADAASSGDEVDLSTALQEADDADGEGDAAFDDGADDEVASADANVERLISAALLLGYGLNLDSDATYRLNPFGIGFGALGGYDLGMLYVGGRIAIFLGDSRRDIAGQSSANELTLGVTVGYPMELRGLRVRPELALGLAVSSGEHIVPASGGAPSQASDTSSEDIYVAPGVMVTHDLDRTLFIGGEAAIPIILSDPDNVIGLTLMFSGGMRF